MQCTAAVICPGMLPQSDCLILHSQLEFGIAELNSNEAFKFLARQHMQCKSSLSRVVCPEHPYILIYSVCSYGMLNIQHNLIKI